MFYFTGDITQKGYEKKRARLLQPYLSKNSTTQGMFIQFIYWLVLIAFGYNLIHYISLFL